MTAPERWAPIPRYPGHEVSTHARVRTLDRTTTDSRGRTLRIKGRLRKTYVDAEGRLAIPIRAHGRNCRELVAVLMLEAFVGPREGRLALHCDDDKLNNTLENLYWGTKRDNSLDSIRNGTHRWASRTHCDAGHEYTPENTYMHDGARHCRTCRRIKKRQRRAARGLTVTAGGSVTDSGAPAPHSGG